MLEVVAAFIKENDKFLICQRPSYKARGLMWEFVGGKVEKGETPQQALARECMEELAVKVKVGEIFTDVTHVYPDVTVHLTLFYAEIVGGSLQKIEHNDIKWITADEIPFYTFCLPTSPFCAKYNRLSSGSGEYYLTVVQRDNRNTVMPSC